MAEKAISFLFLLSIARAARNTPIVAPLGDETFLITHYQQILVFFGLQGFAFFVWVLKTIYEWAVKQKDKTSDKLDRLIESQLRMQDDIQNIKHTMLSKNDAHQLIEAKIEYADKIRSRQ